VTLWLVANSSFQDDPADALSKVQHEANERVDIILRSPHDDVILVAEFLPCVSSKSTGSGRTSIPSNGKFLFLDHVRSMNSLCRFLLNRLAHGPRPIVPTTDHVITVRIAKVSQLMLWSTCVVVMKSSWMPSSNGKLRLDLCLSCVMHKSILTWASSFFED
jgi:hypothetical protein